METGAARWRRNDARQREKGGRPGNEEETAGTATAEAALNRPAQEQKSCCDDCLGDSRASGGHTESHCASSSNIGSSRSSRNCKDLLQPLTSGWASQGPPATASQGGWPLWLAKAVGHCGWPWQMVTANGHGRWSRQMVAAVVRLASPAGQCGWLRPPARATGYRQPKQLATVASFETGENAPASADSPANVPRAVRHGRLLRELPLAPPAPPKEGKEDKKVRQHRRHHSTPATAPEDSGRAEDGGVAQRWRRRRKRPKTEAAPKVAASPEDDNAGDNASLRRRR